MGDSVFRYSQCELAAFRPIDVSADDLSPMENTLAYVRLGLSGCLAVNAAARGLISG